MRERGREGGEGGEEGDGRRREDGGSKTQETPITI